MGVSKVVYGANTLIDLTGDTITAADLMQGVTAHGADGEPITGTYTPGPAPEPFDYSKIKEIGELSHVSGTLVATIARPNSITLNQNGNNNLTGTYIQIQKTTTVVARVAGTYAVSANGSAFQLNTYAANDQIYHRTSGTKRCIVIYIEQ